MKNKTKLSVKWMKMGPYLKMSHSSLFHLFSFVVHLMPFLTYSEPRDNWIPYYSHRCFMNKCILHFSSKYGLNRSLNTNRYFYSIYLKWLKNHSFMWKEIKTLYSRWQLHLHFNEVMNVKEHAGKACNRDYSCYSNHRWAAFILPIAGWMKC